MIGEENTCAKGNTSCTAAVIHIISSVLSSTTAIFAVIVLFAISVLYTIKSEKQK